MDYLYQLEADGTVTITEYLGTEAKVNIPNQIDGHAVTRIEAGAFREKKNLTEVMIPEGVIHIAPYAFYVCHKLMRVHIPSSVTEIGEHCFDYCGKVVTGTRYTNDYESSDPWTRRNAGAYGPAEYYEDVVEFRMTAVVIHGSYAEGYCKAHNIRYTVK